jgi:hypothetical protein
MTWAVRNINKVVGLPFSPFLFILIVDSIGVRQLEYSACRPFTIVIYHTEEVEHDLPAQIPLLQSRNPVSPL